VLLSQGRSRRRNPVQTRIATLADNERGRDNYWYGQDRDERQRQFYLADVARRFVVRSTGTSIVIVMAWT